MLLTHGKFPTYKDSFLRTEVPPLSFFTAVDLAFCLAGVSLGGITLVVTFLSWLTEPVRTASKSSFASAILSKSCEGQRKQ